MRKLIMTLLSAFFCVPVSSQSEFDIKVCIKKSLEGFFELLGSVNDDEEPVSTYYLASEYGGGNYFCLNGKEKDFEEFLRTYSRHDLGKRYVNHSVVVSRDNITKTSSVKSDRRYTVIGRLERKCATDEDYLVRDEAVTAIVRFNGLEKEVSILELKFSSALQVSRPTSGKDDDLSVDLSRSSLHVPYKGGNWKIALRSRSRSVKRYPGIEAATTYGEWSQTPYTASSGLTYRNDEKAQTISGHLGANRSRRKKSYSVNLSQEGSGKTIRQYIEQEGRPRRMFDYDQEEYEHLDVFYSLNNSFGLSHLFTLEDTRFSLGFLIALNNDFFRGWGKSPEHQRETSIDRGKAISGYRMTVTSMYPEEDNYCFLMDPLGKAKEYTSRTLLLAQVGLNLAQWLRFDLGTGAASARKLHYMEKAYALDIYSYERTSQSLPYVADKYVYKELGESHFFRDDVRWSFAFRPALVFHIPLDRYFETSLSLGAGYTYVAGDKEACSPDFTVGIRWGY